MYAHRTTTTNSSLNGNSLSKIFQCADFNTNTLSLSTTCATRTHTHDQTMAFPSNSMYMQFLKSFFPSNILGSGVYYIRQKSGANTFRFHINCKYNSNLYSCFTLSAIGRVVKSEVLTISEKIQETKEKKNQKYRK
jgi:hypothetical protein